MIYCKTELKNNFIIALKSNRKVALSLEDKQNKKYVSIKTLQLVQLTVGVWFEKLDFPLLLTKQVFKNENGTVGELHLACSDLNLSCGQIITIYKKRWAVEDIINRLKVIRALQKPQQKNQQHKGIILSYLLKYTLN